MQDLKKTSIYHSWNTMQVVLMAYNILYDLVPVYLFGLISYSSI